MAINLSKGQRVSLSKGLTNMKLGLGWDPNISTGDDFDLDVSVFMLGENGKLLGENYFVFYNNPASPDGALNGPIDDRTGASSEGDDEEVFLNLTKLDARVSEMIFVVTIHEANERKQNFGQVNNSYIRLVDESKNEEVLNYELDEDFSTETSVEFARIYKKNGEWKFGALGLAYSEGLDYFVNKYL